MKKFKLIALAIVCILSTACFFGCKPDNNSSSAPEESVIEVPTHTCEFGDWVIDEEPTCYAEGSQHRVCIAENCDNGEDGAPYVEVETIEKIAHTWNHEELLHDDEYGVSTCKYAGRVSRKCTVPECGEVEWEFEELADHNFVNGVCSVCSYDPSKSYTYMTYTSVSPSNWNELTYQDNNDTQIMSYIGSPFFEADFKFDAEGNIVPGEFEVEYSFATKLEDITAQYVGEYGIEEGDSSLVWKITIRDDARWDSGEKIVAGDFVYTMQEQLNPLFLNYRADSFYNGSVNIHNARNYAFQGHTVTESARAGYTLWAEAQKDNSLYFDVNTGKSGVMDYFMGSYKSYFDAYGGLWLFNALMGVDVTAIQGKTWAEISASEELTAIWEAALATWKTLPDEELDFFVRDHAYPAFDWSEVGMWAESDTELVLVLDQGIELVDANGDLTYHCFYEFSSLPLVHKATYEACKVEPAIEGGLWTSTYNSSLETTRSWGPYKLTQFQAGKYYVLEKNPNWYGYAMDKYEGQYETTRIECETITSYETAFMKFLSGDLTGIGIDVSKADTYKYSSKAYFTPDDFVGSMQLQSNKAALEQRQTEGVNKVLLSYPDFRKAISLAFNRVEYNNTCTTASLPGFGIFNSMHYYDVANGGVYRNTDIAKKVLCEVYGVDVNEYADLDEAYEAITGYDMEQAQALLEKAYAEALANEEIKATDKVILTVGTSVDNESTRRVFNFIKATLEELGKGTSLDGRLTAEFDTSFGSAWANDFRAGAYDICTGGWTGAAWNPGYFLMAYLSPDYMYSRGWDTASHELELTVHGVKVVEEEVEVESKDEEGNTVKETITVSKYVITNNAEDSFTAKMPVYDVVADEGYNTNWYQLLNNEFRQGVLADEFRLEIIGALEKEILLQYYSVPISYSFAASIISYQVDYITYEYNTFNGYGGIQYMTYHYSDSEWAEYLKNNELDYTK